MATLETRLFFVKSNMELQRMVAAYSNYLSGGQFEKILEMFSNEQDDVRAEMPWGIYRGYDSLIRLYDGFYRNVLCGGSGSVLLPGVLDVHGMNTPVISVAQDGLTARGLWVCPGVFTVQDPDGANGLQSCWCWQKLGCDFIYENDAWKFWHLHAFPLWTAAFETSWTEPQKNPYDAMQNPAFAPDEAPTPDAVPEPPVPYATFAETASY